MLNPRGLRTDSRLPRKRAPHCARGSRMEGVRALQDGRAIHERTSNAEAKGPTQLHLQNASRDRCPVSGHLSPSVLGVDIPKWRSFLIRLTGVPPRALGWKVFEHCKMEEPSMIEHPILKRQALRSSTPKTHPGTSAQFSGALHRESLHPKYER